MEPGGPAEPFRTRHPVIYATILLYIGLLAGMGLDRIIVTIWITG